MQPLFASSDNMATDGYMIQDYFYHALYIQSLTHNWNYTIKAFSHVWCLLLHMLVYFDIIANLVIAVTKCLCVGWFCFPFAMLLFTPI